MTEPHVFISYDPSEQPYAQQVADHLQAQGFGIWINDGKRRWPTISKAIAASGALVVVVTAETIVAKSVARELALAKSLDRPILTIVRGERLPATLPGEPPCFDAPNGELPDAAFCDRLAEHVARSLPAVDSQTAAASDGPQVADNLDDIPTDLDDIAEQPPTPLLTVAALAAPVEPVMHNADWQPVIRTVNGMEMVLVPRGCFLMGDETDAAARPVHTRCIERSFWMGRYPVTTAQYLLAVRQKVCEISRWAGDFRFNDPEQPIVGIGWTDALKFARWHHMRLPTETEWEYAARGPDGWAWPWGDDFVDDNLIYAANANGQTAPVGDRQAGASWAGALDLSGNVTEWCLSAWRADYRAAEDNRLKPARAGRVLRGGSFLDTPDQTRAVCRSSDDPIFGNVNIGFRLVCMAPVLE